MLFRKHAYWCRSWTILCFLSGCLVLISSCKRNPVWQTDNKYSGNRLLGKNLLIPSEGAYTGAYLAFGEAEDQVTLEKIEEFEKNVGKHQAIIASSSFWGEQTFPGHNMEIIARHGSIPLVYWSPWDRPYEQDQPFEHKPKSNQFDLRSILAGKWDSYIDRWADGAKDFGHPIFVAWGLEMNGTWFPWSGYFYETKPDAKVALKSSPRYFSGPEMYKQAYRYVVERVRARGATNILWIFQVNNYSYPSDPWNTIARYYPGPNYVDWLALTAYGKQYNDDPWVTVWDTFYYPYNELCKLDPNKPVMLAEWGIADFPKAGNKADWIKEAFETLSTRFPRIKAAIYWNERWQNEDMSFSNLRVTSSLDSMMAYRHGVVSPYWLAFPLFTKDKQTSGQKLSN